MPRYNVPIKLDIQVVIENRGGIYHCSIPNLDIEFKTNEKNDIANITKVAVEYFINKRKEDDTDLKNTFNKLDEFMKKDFSESMDKFSKIMDETFGKISETFDNVFNKPKK